MEEKKQQGDLDAFGSKLVAVAGTVALKQAVTFEFTQIVAELVQPVGLRRKLERGEDSGVNLVAGPPADGIAAVQENLQ